MIENKPVSARGERRALIPAFVGVENSTHSGEGQLDYTRPPKGMSEDVYELNLLLTAVAINAQTVYRWLNRENANAQAAKKTVSRMNLEIVRINELLSKLKLGRQ